MFPSTQVSPPQSSDLITRIRLCLAIVMVGLLLSGLTAFCLVSETKWLLDHLARTVHFSAGTPLFDWVLRVHLALAATSVTAPFLAYGTDWLALAHILFAILFVGPYRDPNRNRWVINFGLTSCIGVVLLAFIAGPVRQIPFFWRCIDASFAVLCAFPLLLCRHYLGLLDRIESNVGRQLVRRKRRHVGARRSVS